MTNDSACSNDCARVCRDPNTIANYQHRLPFDLAVGESSIRGSKLQRVVRVLQKRIKKYRLEKLGRCGELDLLMRASAGGLVLLCQRQRAIAAVGQPRPAPAAWKNPNVYSTR